MLKINVGQRWLGIALALVAACSPTQPTGADPIAALSAAASSEIKIHFKSPWANSAPTIWVWEGTGNGAAGNRPISELAGFSWPGPAMTKDGTPDWWSWTVPSQLYPLSPNLSFKFASGNQVNLTGSASSSAWYDGASWSGSNPDTGTPPAAGITVYSQQETHIFWWSSTPANAPANVGWPGVAMGTDAASGWKTYAFPNARAINLILSNAGAGQSPDLSRTTGTWWYSNGVWTAAKPVVSPPATGTLGAIYTPSATTFRIWSPDSAQVTVTVAGVTHPCVGIADFNGYTQIYQAVVSGDLRGQSYQFAILGTAVRDPYAVLVNPGTTQGIVGDLSSVLPTQGGWAARPPLVNREDSIVYEVHVRDFTIDPNSGVDPARRGKFGGLIQPGTTFNGAKTGLDHLKELGITHVQLMPVYDFATPAYNWGYDPVNYSVPEEQYAQATTAEGRVREFKDMINGFHSNGIRVILDVVYNHTYSKDALGPITGKYYTPVDLSGTGNALDDGNPMVSRMIRDSLEHWVREYNVDGFRFDLIGVFYAANVANWGSHLNATFPDRNLLLYGEPWNGFATDPNEAQKVRLGKVPTLASARVGVFNGQYREALKGGSDDASRNYIFNAAQNPGALWWGAIAAGMRGSIMAVKSTNALPNSWDSMFAFDPEQSINYLSAHDNLDLWDKINFAGVAGGATGYAGRVDRFGTGIILTSQGIPFLHAGDEFLRSKAFGGDYATAKNSYNASDDYNMIRWADKVTNASTNKYYRDAIALRKATPTLRLTNWDAINSQVKTALNAGANNAAAINTVNDSTLPANVVVSYLSSSPAAPTDTIVVFNPATTFNLTLPSGVWTKVFDANGAVNKKDAACEGTAVTVFKRN